MSYVQVDLKNKIVEMYPEVIAHDIDVSMDFSDEKDAWEITFAKNAHELKTYLSKSDADECMDGNLCLHLGIQLGEFVSNFERVS